MTRILGFLTVALAVVLAACAPATRPIALLPGEIGESRGASSPIEHVVILVQENRSFDNLFATYKGADGARYGTTHDGRRVPLVPKPLATRFVIDHTYRDYRAAYDSGKMDGFDLEEINGGTHQAHLVPYAYVAPFQIKPYFDLANQYVLADRLFQTQGSGSFVAHQDLIAGSALFNSTYSLVDSPSNAPWGCDAPPDTVTSLIDKGGKYLASKGPFPCFNYPTLAHEFYDKGLSWKYYTPPLLAPGSTGILWNAFDAIYDVRYLQWNHVSVPETNVLSDIAERQLPAVAWVIPDAVNSDHPGYGRDTGPSWVTSIVNAIGKSKYWKSTAIVVLWDDWGGFYDHVPPPQLGFGGLGFRVPMLVISPYAKRGYVSHAQYEFASIVKFVEETFGLGRLGDNDRRARSIGDVFDFTQSPRRFVPIAAKYPQSYFEREKPSLQPVDDQ